jgi:MOSC domain-containing protein YiiM
MTPRDSVRAVAHVGSVNVAACAVRIPTKRQRSGIGKMPVDGPVTVRAPGVERGGPGSGLVGDVIGDSRHHGGTDQAVYAYSRERLDDWERQLGRPLRDGMFGENLTTSGLDVDGAVLGERWQIGDEVELQVTVPRIPCATFRGWMNEPGWVKRFAAAGLPGAYLRVLTGGEIMAGDAIDVIHRPAHGVSVALTFRALLNRPDLLRDVAAAGDDLTDELRSMVAAGRTFRLEA